MENKDNNAFDNPISQADEELLTGFFETFAKTEIPDDGFSRKVMEGLPPSSELSAMRKTVRLERLWTLLCVVVGIVFFVAEGGYSLLRVAFARILSDLGGIALHLINLLSASYSVTTILTLLAIVYTLSMVFAYNLAMDARMMSRNQ